MSAGAGRGGRAATAAGAPLVAVVVAVATAVAGLAPLVADRGSAARSAADDLLAAFVELLSAFEDAGAGLLRLAVELGRAVIGA